MARSAALSPSAARNDDPIATGVGAGHLVVGVVLANVERVRFARCATKLEAGHQRHEVVVFGKLEQHRPRCDRCHLGLRVERLERAEVGGPLLADLPERQEPVAPAGRRRDQDGRPHPLLASGDDRREHRAEVVPDHGEAVLIDVVPGGEQIEPGGEARDLAFDGR